MLSLEDEKRRNAQVGKDGTLVRGVDDLTLTEAVAELSANGSTLGDLVDGLGYRLNVGVDPAIADDVVAVHVLDGLEGKHQYISSHRKCGGGRTPL